MERNIDRSRANAELQARSVVDILDNIHRLEDAPLQPPQGPADKRAVGVCRHFSLMLCSVLRSKGLPARIRCGFAPYFERHRFEKPLDL